MKYANQAGVVSALFLIGICFVPWVYISPVNTTLTGISTPNTSLGSPGLMNIVMCVAAVIFFLVRTIWAKRLNVFVGAFNMAWAIRNYLLVTQCQLGECPEKKFGIYAVVFLSAILLIMALFPKMDLKKEDA